jgi:hypothetical protein
VIHQTKDFEKLLQSFVKELRGRYNKHISDEMLCEVLELLITQRMAFYKKEPVVTAVYQATFPLFEKILEYNLNMGGNGHHVAGDLAERFAENKNDE